MTTDENKYQPQFEDHKPRLARNLTGPHKDKRFAECPCGWRSAYFNSGHVAAEAMWDHIHEAMREGIQSVKEARPRTKA